MQLNSSDDSDDEWSKLETIKSFDLSVSEVSGVSTNGLDLPFINNTSPNNDNHHHMGNLITVFPTKATTPVSLLVESLIQQLCSLLEPADADRSKNLYMAICKQLEEMNLIDESWGRGEFEAMRIQYQKALYQLVSVAKGQDLPTSMQSVWPLQTIGLDWSRYHKEFEELAFIAGGGFGKVFKARNKLDGIVYAVKKVTIKAITIDKVLSHLAEVKTLASLHHINIVPYKAAWLEPLIAPSKESQEVEMDEEFSSEEYDETEEENVKMKSQKRFEMEENSSEFIEFERTSTSSGNVWTSVEVKSKRNTRLKNLEVIHFEDIQQNKSCSNLEIVENQPHLKLKWAILYIQMALCQLTLRDWLDQRNKNFDRFEEFYQNFLNESESKNYSVRRTFSTESAEGEQVKKDNWTHLEVVGDIFSQIINGLNYIHARKIIHHDLKPGNIFVGVDSGKKLIIQLGDFGLACPLQNEHGSAVIGTPQYAAPEQLEGHCNIKSDVYSLGIILLELLIPLNTEMERGKTIENIRKRGIIPEQINSSYKGLLKQLLQPHQSRPDSFELMELFGKIRTNRDATIEDLQKKLSQRDQELAELKIQLEEQTKAKVSVQAKDDDSKTDKVEKRDEELQSQRSEIETRDQVIQSKNKEIKRLKKLLYCKVKS